MTVSRILPAGVPAVWPAVAPMLKAALAVSGGRHPLWSVLDELVSGRADLWVACADAARPVAAVVCRVAQYPARRFYQLHAIGGSDMDAWIEPMLAAIEDRARALGCDGIEGGGRHGWGRVGARLGFREATVWLEKDL